jgi:hypothetical protein
VCADLVYCLVMPHTQARGIAGGERTMITNKLVDPLRLPPQTDPPRSPRETLPTMCDLPSEDAEEPGLSDEFPDPCLHQHTIDITA